MAKETDAYMAELIAEKRKLDTSMIHCSMLLAQEIDRVQTGASKGKMIDVHVDKPTQISTKIRIPCKEYPKVNFVGRILGQKGCNLKRIQEETGTKISVQGRGSMRDFSKEEGLRKEGGKYSHLADDLHVNIDTYGKAAECHQRMSNAIFEISKYLSPDYVDEEAEAYPTNGAELPPAVHGWPAGPPGLVMPPVLRGRGPELPPRPPVPAVRPVRLAPYGSPGYPAPVRRAHPLSPPVLPGPRPVGMRPPHLHPRGPPGPHPHHVPRVPHYGIPPARPFMPPVHNIEPIGYDLSGYELADMGPSSVVEDFTSDDWAKEVTTDVVFRGKAPVVRPMRGHPLARMAHPYAR